MLLSAALICGFSSVVANTAQADEMRLGVMVHDAQFFEDIIFGGRHGKEQSISATAEYVWDSPEWLSWAWSPMPYIGGTVNLEGETSHAGAGLLWRVDIRDGFYFDIGSGLVVHDGEVRTPDPLTGTTVEEVAEFRRRKFTEIEFGSQVLFRNQFALGYRFNEKWAGEITFEHLSHGQILGGPENEGSNNVGFRVARRW